MLEIVFEVSSFLHVAASFKGGHPFFKYTLPKLAILFDNLLHTGDALLFEEIEKQSYGKLTQIPPEHLLAAKKYTPPTIEQINDLKVALGDEPDGVGGEYAYLGTRCLLQFVRENGYYLYVLPGLREGFLKFCLKYEPDYFPIMKESFLLLDILEFLFEEEIPSFDPIKSKDMLPKFANYKQDFQKGILSYLKKFQGSYNLSKEQKKHLKESLANDEKRLLDFLQLENLKKIDKLSLVGDVIKEGISLFLPMPLGLLIDIGKELEDVQEFKKAMLDFPLSLIILKKMTNIGTTKRSINCAVCAISPAELETLTDEQANDIMYNRELCVEHMVARLDLRKRFGLYGKARLMQMKRLGDASIWMEPE